MVLETRMHHRTTSFANWRNHCKYLFVYSALFIGEGHVKVMDDFIKMNEYIMDSFLISKEKLYDAGNINAISEVQQQTSAFTSTKPLVTRIFTRQLKSTPDKCFMDPTNGIHQHQMISPALEDLTSTSRHYKSLHILQNYMVHRNSWSRPAVLCLRS